MAREFDSPWKEGLDFLLDRFLEMFHSDLHAAINWSIPIIVLDPELESILREGELGKTVHV
jgi:hypothetical protein